MNVRFFGGRKEEYVSIPKHNPIGLYFCTDSRELFLGDRLLSDGLRVVSTAADLPSISEHKAAEGVIYFVAATQNGYVLPRGGSEWLQVIYAPTTGIEADLSGYYTKAEVDEAILEAIANVKIDVDLTGYATEEFVDKKVAAIEIPEVPTKVSDLENDAGFISEHQDLGHLATKAELETAIKSIEHPTIDLSGYATEVFVHDEIAKIVIPDVSNFITEAEVDAKGFLTEHQSLEGYAKVEDLPKFDNFATKAEIPSLDGYAKIADIPDVSKFITEVPSEYITETELASKGFISEHQDISHLATKEELPDVSSFITLNDVEAQGYLTEIPNDLITEAELESKGFLTEHQDLSDYAKRSELPNVEGLASEDFVAEAIAEIEFPEADLSEYSKTTEMSAAIEAAAELKADKVLFTTAKYVNSPIGGFTVGEDLNGRTIAELFAKLLELTDKKPGTEEPDEPEIPDEPTTIPDKIITNSSAMYQVNELGDVIEIPYSYKAFFADEYAAEPTQDCFYQLKDAEGNITESGYQHMSEENDSMYYVVLLPKDLDFNTNVLVQSWDAILQEWSVDNVVMSNDLAMIEEAFAEAELTLPEYNAEEYTLWIDASLDTCSGIDYRFIIKE